MAAGAVRILPPGPFLLVLAGPNGAGKSTFFDRYLSRVGIPFVNADRIAKALSPEAPATVAYEAASAADRERRRLVTEGVSFCMETVFSDPAGEKVAFLREAQARGYEVLLVYVGLEAPELCIGRILQRLEEGGHDVPDRKVLERYPRSLANLRAAVAFVDGAYLYDNSSCDDPYRMVAAYRRGRLRQTAECLPSWAAGLPGLRPRRRPLARPKGEPATPRRGAGTGRRSPGG